MSSDNKLLSLKTLSLTATSLYFWGLQSIRKKIQIYFQIEISYHHADRKWLEIQDDVCNEAEHCCLPKQLQSELLERLPYVGRALLDWTAYVIKILKLDIKYAQTVCLLENGHINERSIFDSYWFPDVKFKQIARTKPEEIFVAFNLACLFAHVQFIKKFQAEMIEEINKLLPPLKVENDQNACFYIISVGLSYYHFRCNAVSTLRFLTNDSKKITITSLEMLEICLVNKLGSAFLYFWSALQIQEKHEYFKKISVSKLNYLTGNGLAYEDRNLFKIIAILFWEMQEHNFPFKNILNNNFAFFFANALKEKTFQKNFLVTIAATLHNLKQKFMYEAFYREELNTFLNFLLKDMSYLRRSKCDVAYHARFMDYILRIPGFVLSADNIHLISVLQ